MGRRPTHGDESALLRFIDSKFGSRRSGFPAATEPAPSARFPEAGLATSPPEAEFTLRHDRGVDGCDGFHQPRSSMKLSTFVSISNLFPRITSTRNPFRRGNPGESGGRRDAGNLNRAVGTALMQPGTCAIFCCSLDVI
jgi:hypothetical protein